MRSTSGFRADVRLHREGFAARGLDRSHHLAQRVGRSDRIVDARDVAGLVHAHDASPRACEREGDVASEPPRR
jgi:hypothetical protein